MGLRTRMEFTAARAQFGIVANALRCVPAVRNWPNVRHVDPLKSLVILKQAATLV